MRIFVTPATDVFDGKRRAKQFLQALSEYGARPRMKDGEYSEGPSYFDVDLPHGMHQNDLTEMLDALGAQGVNVQKEDVTALVLDPIARRGVTQLIQKKLVNASEIPVEEVGNSLRSWSDSLWLEPTDLTEEQEQEAYEQIVSQLPKEGFGFGEGSDHAGSDGSLRGLIDESDRWLKEHASEHPGSAYEPSRWTAR